ncbi:armadillo repeat-containing protein 6 homolog isoform X1 [Danaus plexippus]|uniref:armadillo repeat-containing protein 6 homolog isoform X1 n=1 Tax=Danaus plexippus TaxID=13037 RepID=UPI002AB313F0|nr:armadillo repeat-containing protein 6 homolog isoform X1 [Danaus plexippus]
MVRVITQDTYDEVVKENIEEFDMSPEEAIKEAIDQFEAQGVDLTNIIKDLALGSGDKHLVLTTVEKLKELCSNNKNDTLIMNEFEILKAECSKDIAHRVMAGKAGAYNILIDLLDEKLKMYKNVESEENKQFIVKILNCLVALMEVQPDLLDKKGVDLIDSCLDLQNDEIIISTLKWINECCTKHEINRQNLFATNIGKKLKILLGKNNVQLLCEVLQVIRKFTLDDDIRVEFGKAHEHARDLGVLLLESLAGLLKKHTTPPLVSELMWTTSTLLVRHELCSRADLRAELMSVLCDNYDNVVVIQQACKLITALAGNDDVKRDIINGGIVPVVVSLLGRHASNAPASALILKCIAALSLREPNHAKQFLQSGVIKAIVDCIKIHPNSSQVQKNACWAIRNLVSRCREYNSQFHELDIEALLNQTYNKFNKEFGFDVKSALRDLECDVKFEEQWTGRGGEIEQ